MKRVCIVVLAVVMTLMINTGCGEKQEKPDPCETGCVVHTMMEHPETDECHCHGQCNVDDCECHGSH